MFDRKNFDKNHLQSETSIDKRALLDRAMDCDFHHHVKSDMVRSMTNMITEKVRFTEENDTGSYDLKVRADVYVFSPDEIDTYTRRTEEALNAKDGRIAELERMNKNQLAHIQRVEKELLHLQRLAVEISMFSPPPVYIVMDPPKPQDVDDFCSSP